ncbi:MAG: glycosyltransferase [Acidobacteriota bacterium]
MSPSPGTGDRRRLLIFIVAYKAESHIEDVLRRIPPSLDAWDTEVLVVDDASDDATFERGHRLERSGELPFPVTVLYNPENQGYGGNQKIGFQYAIEHGFDAVALLHGDGQYAPELLPELVEPILDGRADAVFGSRMMERFRALRGGMPAYKYLGNRILTGFQNTLLGTSLSEFHSGYRIYSVKALARLPFHLNTPDFHFDTEIIIQLHFAEMRILELPIPTYYGDEICRVNGLRYAWDVVTTTLLARAQRYDLFYRRNLDVELDQPVKYAAKLHYVSPASLAFERIGLGERVVDIGSAGGELADALIEQKGCTLTCIDQHVPDSSETSATEFVQCDLDVEELPISLDDRDTVLMLDVIEHLRSPEAFVAQLHRLSAANRDIRFIVSSGNAVFFITRAMMLLGQLNYAKRGILDMTHSRLFTFRSLIRLFEQGGFQVETVVGVPAPFPLALGDGKLSRFLLRMNHWLIKLSRGLFAYQSFLVLRPLPRLESLLDRARIASSARSEELDRESARVAST